MIFILEGMDGTGKTYCLNYLEKELKARNIQVRSLTEKSFIKDSGDRYSLIKDSGFNTDIIDVKHLLYLARAISCYEDMFGYDRLNPDSITIKDRGWLTVLVYMILDQNKQKIKTVEELQNLVRSYMEDFQAPETTFFFLSDFNINQVRHRNELKDYYTRFDGNAICEEYFKWSELCELKQNVMTVCSATDANYDERNKLVLDYILAKYNLKKLERKEDK